jgi:protein-tyrosine-phosphatase/DNA-binding transcriptional ArsR family regulator
MSTPTLVPPEVLQLAGHPLRWRLLAELARSDRVVAELTELIGEPQNLVSYHLAKLRQGGLVSGHRSAADRRDSYYALDLARLSRMLTAAGGALHPGLRLAPPQVVPLGDRAALRPARVLFLCSGNSTRSQMAEALLRARGGDAVEVVSAGSHPKPLHPNAIRVMAQEYGLDISGQQPKRFDVFEGQRFDVVISLCDRVREVCPDFAGPPETTHWSLPNPATGEPDEVTWPLFQATAAELSTRIDFLLAALADRGAGPDA